MSTILVIEGEPVAGLIREYLTIRGFNAITADDAAGAIDALRRRPPDAVVVDPFHLGRAHGEFLRELSIESNNRPLPLVVLKPPASPPAAYRAMAAAASAVLPHPLELSRLATTLHSGLAAHHGRDCGDRLNGPIFTFVSHQA